MAQRRVGLSALAFGGLLLVSWSVDGIRRTVAANAVPREAGAGQSAGAKVDPATAGAVTGKVVLQGTAPANAAIKMNADPNCLKATTGQPQTQETFTTGAGNGLQNVFVYLRDGLGRYAYDVPKTPVVIDQKLCRYHPHVFGIRVGQPLEIRNSDDTLHNIHAMPDENLEFNLGQPVKGMRVTRTFTTQEVMVPIRCDVHGWMNAYVGVMAHPYFAVSGANGTFDIQTVPPGTYTLEAWHERLGTATQQVVVGAKQTKDVIFVFKTT
jgi:plastocyanin